MELIFSIMSSKLKSRGVYFFQITLDFPIQVYVPQNIHKIYLLNKILGKIFFSHFFVLLYAPTY